VTQPINILFLLKKLLRHTICKYGLNIGGKIDQIKIKAITNKA